MFLDLSSARMRGTSQRQRPINNGPKHYFHQDSLFMCLSLIKKIVLVYRSVESNHLRRNVAANQWSVKRFTKSENSILARERASIVVRRTRSFHDGSTLTNAPSERRDDDDEASYTVKSSLHLSLYLFAFFLFPANVRDTSSEAYTRNQFLHHSTRSTEVDREVAAGTRFPFSFFFPRGFSLIREGKPVDG